MSEFLKVYFLQVRNRFDEVRHEVEPEGIKTLRVNCDGNPEITTTRNVDGKPKHPPGLGWVLMYDGGDSSDWARCLIEVRRDDDVEADALRDFGGDREKVRTAVDRVHLIGRHRDRDVIVKSRYGKYTELRLMTAIYYDFAPGDKAAFEEISCDSKSGGFFIRTKDYGVAAAEELGDEFITAVFNLSTRTHVSVVVEYSHGRRLTLTDSRCIRNP